MKKEIYTISLFLLSKISTFCAEQDSPSHTLHYDKPSSSGKIEKEALPIGNGFFGGMVFGGVVIGCTTPKQSGSLKLNKAEFAILIS